MSAMWWGALSGGGLALMRHALRPPAPALAWALAEARRPRDPTGPTSSDLRRRRSWWRPDAADLMITGTSEKRFVASVLTTSAGLAAVMVVWMAALSLLGMAPGVGVAVVGISAAVVGGVVLPGELVRRRARQQRLAFGHALSTFLDLIGVLLAGGAGIETSLSAAAHAGDGWAFALLRDELVRARTRRMSPWAGLRDLGERLGIVDLIDLAVTVQLAGEHGARVRNSLTSRAAAVRERHLAQVEAQAQAATERMGLPMVLVFVGFVALLGYPALSLITGGL